ncbi:MAG: hypothetical protein MUD05_07880, partial [Candidatus Nanopelagicales bacterium]|nr:hypothetical protein [Candidatus Nanopelagicales bacterium]
PSAAPNQQSGKPTTQSPENRMTPAPSAAPNQQSGKPTTQSPENPTASAGRVRRKTPRPKPTPVDDESAGPQIPLSRRPEVISDVTVTVWHPG